MMVVEILRDKEAIRHGEWRKRLHGYGYEPSMSTTTYSWKNKGRRKG